MWQGGNGWDDLMREQVEESTLKQRLGECFKFFVSFILLYLSKVKDVERNIFILNE